MMMMMIAIVAVSSSVTSNCMLTTCLSHYTIVMFMTIITLGEQYCYEASHEGCTNPRRQVAVATKFYTVAPNSCVSSVCELRHPSGA
jgi:hypothetical protein